MQIQHMIYWRFLNLYLNGTWIIYWRSGPLLFNLINQRPPLPPLGYSQISATIFFASSFETALKLNYILALNVLRSTGILSCTSNLYQNEIHECYYNRAQTMFRNIYISSRICRYMKGVSIGKLLLFESAIKPKTCRLLFMVGSDFPIAFLLTRDPAAM